MNRAKTTSTWKKGFLNKTNTNSKRQRNNVLDNETNATRTDKSMQTSTLLPEQENESFPSSSVTTDAAGKSVITEQTIVTFKQIASHPLKKKERKNYEKKKITSSSSALLFLEECNDDKVSNNDPRDTEPSLSSFLTNRIIIKPTDVNKDENQLLLPLNTFEENKDEFVIKEVESRPLLAKKNSYNDLIGSCYDLVVLRGDNLRRQHSKLPSNKEDFESSNISREKRQLSFTYDENRARENGIANVGSVASQRPLIMEEDENFSLENKVAEDLVDPKPTPHITKNTIRNQHNSDIFMKISKDSITKGSVLPFDNKPITIPKQKKFEPSPTLSSLPTELSLFFSKILKMQKQIHAAVKEGSDNDYISQKRRKVEQSFLDFIRTHVSTEIYSPTATINDAASPTDSSYILNLSFIWNNTLESIASYAKERALFRRTSLYSTTTSIPFSRSCHHFLPPTILLGLHVLNHFQADSWTTLVHIASISNGFDCIKEVKETVEIQQREEEEISNITVTREEKNAVDTKRQRMKTLGATILMKIQLQLLLNNFCSSHNESKRLGIEAEKNLSCNEGYVTGSCSMVEAFHASPIVFTLLLEKVLPLMVSIILKSNEECKRTLLSSMCMDIVFCILQVSALRIQKQKSTEQMTMDSNSIQEQQKDPTRDGNTLSFLMWKAVPFIELLLGIRKGWIKVGEILVEGNSSHHDTIVTSTIAENSSKSRKNYSDATRRCCSLAIINDWSSILSKVKLMYDKIRFTDGCNEENALKKATNILCNEISGVHLSKNWTAYNHKSNNTFVRFGGMAHTLCKDDPSSDEEVQNMMIALEASIYYMQTNFEGTNNDDGRADSESEEIAPLRSFCSWLGSKKSLRMLSLMEFGNDSKGECDGIELAVQKCMVLLRSKSERCLDLVLASL